MQPWTTRESAIAQADLTRVQDAAAATETRLIAEATAHQGAQIRGATDSAAKANSTAQFTRAYSVATTFVAKTWARGQNLVESGWANLGLYAAQQMFSKGHLGPALSTWLGNPVEPLPTQTPESMAEGVVKAISMPSRPRWPPCSPRQWRGRYIVAGA